MDLIKKFEKTVVTALQHHAANDGCGETDLAASLSLTQDKQVVFTLLKARKDGNGNMVGLDKVRELSYVKDIMLKRIDLTGQSLIVPQFISNILVNYAEQYSCGLTEVAVNIHATSSGSTVMYLYVKKEYKETVDLKELLAN